MLKWLENAVFYQIYPISFFDSNLEKSTDASASFIFPTHSHGAISGEKNSENLSREVGKSNKSCAFIMGLNY